MNIEHPSLVVKELAHGPQVFSNIGRLCDSPFDIHINEETKQSRVYRLKDKLHWRSLIGERFVDLRIYFLISVT